MIIYKVKSEVMRIGANRDKVLYYTVLIAQGKITSDQVEDRIINLTALSRDNVRSAITALAKIVRKDMFKGRMVDLTDRDWFKSISTAKRMETEEDTTLKIPHTQIFPKQVYFALPSYLVAYLLILVNITLQNPLSIGDSEDPMHDFARCFQGSLQDFARILTDHASPFTLPLVNFAVRTRRHKHLCMRKRTERIDILYNLSLL